MTHLEIRAMLRRVDARQLRESAGISSRTVQRALGISAHRLSQWERGLQVPCSPAGMAWARVIADLERHAAVSAEIAAIERRAA